MPLMRHRNYFTDLSVSLFHVICRDKQEDGYNQDGEDTDEDEGQEADPAQHPQNPSQTQGASAYAGCKAARAGGSRLAEMRSDSGTGVGSTPRSTARVRVHAAKYLGCSDHWGGHGQGQGQHLQDTYDARKALACSNTRSRKGNGNTVEHALLHRLQPEEGQPRGPVSVEEEGRLGQVLDGDGGLDTSLEAAERDVADSLIGLREGLAVVRQFYWIPCV